MLGFILFFVVLVIVAWFLKIIAWKTYWFTYCLVRGVKPILIGGVILWVIWKLSIFLMRG